MVAQYFANLDTNNVVMTVHAVTSEFIAANPERYTGTWVETFIDDPNKTYAGIGYTYDADLDEFIAPVIEP